MRSGAGVLFVRILRIATDNTDWIYIVLVITNGWFILGVEGRLDTYLQFVILNLALRGGEC